MKTILLLGLLLTAHSSLADEFFTLPVAPTPTPAPSATPMPVLTAEQKAMTSQAFPNRFAQKVQAGYVANLAFVQEFYKLMNDTSDGLTPAEHLAALNPKDRVAFVTVANQLIAILLEINPRAEVPSVPAMP